MSLRTLLPLLALLLPHAVLSAQDSGLAPGTRVRVWEACAGEHETRSCRPVVGRLVAPADDNLLIEDARGTTRRIDPAAGVRIDRSAGYRRHTLLGLGAGALMGLGTGAVLVSGCTQGGRGEDDGLCNIYYLVTVPAGAGLGTLIGALTRSERWQPAYSGGAATLRVSPRAGGAAVAFSIPF